MNTLLILLSLPFIIVAGLAIMWLCAFVFMLPVTATMALVDWLRSRRHGRGMPGSGLPGGI
jgi:hypothetical protein